MNQLETRYSGGELFFRFGAALFAALCAGAIFGLFEGLTLVPAQKLTGALFNGAITGVVCLGIGGGFVSALQVLFGFDGTAPRRWIPLLHGDTPRQNHRFVLNALLIPAVVFCWMIIAFHAVRIAITRFHHMGLAALLIMGLMALTALILLLLFSRIRRWLQERLESRFPRGNSRLIALAALCVGPISAAVIVWLSPESGEGLFSFSGLLKREALDLGFLIPIALVIAAVLASLTFASSLRRRAAVVPSFLITGAVIAGFVRAAAGLESVPAVADRIASGTDLSRMALPLLRKPFDRDHDGASRLFGGGDCDDRRADVNPAAIDIAGNGVDEDCSGRDAALVQPEKTTASITSAPKVEIQKNLSMLFISVDALRHDVATPAYRKGVSPNIEALARRSVVFQRSWAMSSFTGRAIGPMMIGKYPSETYCNSVHLPRYHKENQTLAEILQAAGVRTAAVHAHPYFNHSGLDQGFDRHVVVDGKGGAEADLRVSGDISADAAIEILKDPGFTADRFFLWIHFMDPHKEYLPQADHSEFGDDSRGRYDGEVAFTDVQIGRVLDALSAAGLTERTAIMFTADHGEAFGEHGIRFHGRALWEEIVRVPWFWQVPGIAPRAVDLPVAHIDLVRSVLSIFNVEAPVTVGGRSLLDAMTDGTGSPEPIYIEQPEGEYMPPMNALIIWPHKLIHTIVGNRYQLFNLATDPGETNDLAAEQADVLMDMKSRYSSIRGGIQYNADRYIRK